MDLEKHGYNSGLRARVPCLSSDISLLCDLMQASLFLWVCFLFYKGSRGRVTLNKCKQKCSDFQTVYDADLGPSGKIPVQAKEDRVGERITLRMSKETPRNCVS